MPITSLKSSNNTLPNLIMYALSILGVVAAIYFAKQLISNFDGFQRKSALTVDVYNGTAEVFLNDKSLGTTPFSSKEIAPGDNKIRIKGDGREMSTQIEFIPNDKNYIHNVGIFADLGTSDVFSSSQEFWFQRDKSGDVLKVVSDPADGAIFIDNTQVGKTPFSSDKLSEGEYDLRVDYPGYETQTARINIKKGYTLNIRFKLFPIPAPTIVGLLEGATDFYNLSSDNQAVISDTQNWVKAAVYWNKTRGLNIEGTGLNKEQIFDYFVDYKGNLFDSTGTIISNDQQMAAIVTAKKGTYLGRNADGTGVTAEAKATILKMGQTGVGGKKATILETGTGWLRVRETPGLAGVEIAKVNVGTSYSVLAQQTGWVKIKISETVSGWVSADFVKTSE